MNRYRLIVEYFGKDLAGWQIQRNAPSVQQHLEEAIFKFCGQKIVCFSAGRTDAGVHALAQVVHFDIDKEFPPFMVRDALNFYLIGLNIIILEATKVDSDFHARFSAKKRFYKYIIYNRPIASVIEKDLAWHVRNNLDVNKMKEAAKFLIGHHDFTSFRDSQCQGKSPIKTLEQLDIEKIDDKIFIYLSAKSFLHHMVRNIVGSLKLVGTDKWEINQIKTALEARDRKAAGPTAPAHGLYFVKVEY